MCVLWFFLCSVSLLLLSDFLSNLLYSVYTINVIVHAHLKKKAFQLQNTKMHSSRRIAFFAGKRARAINLHYVENRSIPFSRR